MTDSAVTRTKTFRSKPTENAVEAAICGFMREHGWRATRNHVGRFRPVSGGNPITIGTKGFPDWTFTRRSPLGNHATLQLMHVETKRPGQKPRPEQFERIASLNYIGELSVWCASLDHFRNIYLQYFPEER